MRSFVTRILFTVNLMRVTGLVNEDQQREYLMNNNYYKQFQINAYIG